MTDVVVPVTTFWDVLANALDDPWFWILSAVGAFGTALIIRSKINRRCLAQPGMAMHDDLRPDRKSTL